MTVISAEMLTAAEGLLATALGGSPTISDVDRIDEGGRSAVFRLQVAGAKWPSVVLKRAVRADDDAFDPDDQRHGGPTTRLWNEWAGLEFLSDVPSTVTPTFLGGDARLGFVLIEDLGGGPSLATLLLGDDGIAAVRGLYGYATTLAAMHAATIARAAEYEVRRAAFGPLGPRTLRLIGFAWDRLAELLGSLDASFQVSAEATEAAQLVDTQVADAGPFLAYSPHDCCPDNNRVARNGTVRLFDLEFGGCRHALLDVAYFHSTMPTCWCVRRVPPILADNLVEHYKTELLGRDPPGRDLIEERFAGDLAACRLQWALRSAAGHLVRLDEDGEDPGRYWDAWNFRFCSTLQLLVFRLEQVADAGRADTRFSPLVDFALAGRDVVVKRWGRTEPVDVYPALAAYVGDP